MAQEQVRLELLGVPPLREQTRYTFSLCRDPEAGTSSLEIPSFQYNEFDDYGHVSQPEQERWVFDLLSELKIPSRYVWAGVWQLDQSADLDRVRVALLARLSRAPPA
jgi:hypothetical protein